MENAEEQIREDINQLKTDVDMIKNNKNIKDKSLRVKSDNNGKSNILKRVSNNFSNKIENINNKREENGFDNLSFPKITDLIVKHKTHWKRIEQDIMFFNTELDTEEKQEDFINGK